MPGGRWTVLLVASLALGLAFQGCGGPAVPANLGPGDPAPDFSLKDLNGNKVSLREYRGKLVLLNFWATYCEPCRDEMPQLMALHDAYKAKDVVVVGISLDETGAAAVRPFVEALRIGYPILLGDSNVFTRYRGLGIPMTVLIGRDGKIAKKWIGAKSRHEFEGTILGNLSAPGGSL
jgi:peroxiredoxin